MISCIIHLFVKMNGQVPEKIRTTLLTPLLFPKMESFHIIQFLFHSPFPFLNYYRIRLGISYPVTTKDKNKIFLLKAYWRHVDKIKD